MTHGIFKEISRRSEDRTFQPADRVRFKLTAVLYHIQYSIQVYSTGTYIQHDACRSGGIASATEGWCEQAEGDAEASLAKKEDQLRGW